MPNTISKETLEAMEEVLKKELTSVPLSYLTLHLTDPKKYPLDSATTNPDLEKYY